MSALHPDYPFNDLPTDEVIAILDTCDRMAAAGPHDPDARHEAEAELRRRATDADARRHLIIRAHRGECDEGCSPCDACNRATGDSVCDRTCPHAGDRDEEGA